MVGTRHVRMLCLGLRAARALLVLALPATVLAFWFTSPQPPDLGESESLSAETQTRREPAMHDLAWYAPLWQRDLGQPPIPPSPVEAPKAPVDPGPVPTLVATLIESGGSFAHLTDRKGKVQMRGIDELIDRYRVRDIRPGRVQLQDGERLVWVEIPRRKGSRK